MFCIVPSLSLRTNVTFGPLDKNLTNPGDYFYPVWNPVPGNLLFHSFILCILICHIKRIIVQTQDILQLPHLVPLLWKQCTIYFLMALQPPQIGIPFNITKSLIKFLYFSWQRQLWGFNFSDFHNWNGVYVYPYIISAKSFGINVMYPGAPIFTANTNNNNRALFQLNVPDPSWNILFLSHFLF